SLGNTAVCGHLFLRADGGTGFGGSSQRQQPAAGRKHVGGNRASRRFKPGLVDSRRAAHVGARRLARGHPAASPPENVPRAAAARLMSVPREALRSREVTALSSVDSPAVFVAKSLLIPTIPLATLGACLGVADEPLRGGYILVG